MSLPQGLSFNHVEVSGRGTLITLFLQGLPLNPVGMSVTGMFLSLIFLCLQITLFLQGLSLNPVGISVAGMFLVTKESAPTVS